MPGAPGTPSGSTAMVTGPNGTTAVPPPPPPPPPPGFKSGGGGGGSNAAGGPDVRAFSVFSGNGDKDTQRRLRSNMLIMDSAAGHTRTDEQKSASNALNQSDPNKAFTSNVLQATEAEKATATRLNNLNMTIAQGKIVNAVLETAINTDLPGTLRAIVSRDTYAEAGREIMIPKGSRLIGVYNTGIARGQKRVLIIWTRLIRPDGLDIMIGSPGVDNLGRAGIEGAVDNRYTEIFSTALLTSTISIGMAVGADALISDPGTTTTNANGTTSTGSAGSTAASQAVNNVGNIAKDVVNTMLDLRPTITIDQGTPISVFVNRDLSFPGNLLGSTFIQ